MNLWKFQQVLADRNIPVHYDENDYEEDLENLREIGRL
jgi:predicted HTH domain antitoxin